MTTPRSAISLSPAEVERFWAKVDASGDCWLWTASTVRGYGQFKCAGRMLKPHRVAWSLLVGEPPEVLDHLCRVRRCVNPDHLEPVTNRENLMRSPLSLGKTHCCKGHLLAGENLVVVASRGRSYRRCRQCRNEPRRVAFKQIQEG